jgi:intracellular sulfur oxidation DsrE/DsrF family protein
LKPGYLIVIPVFAVAAVLAYVGFLQVLVPDQVRAEQSATVEPAAAAISAPADRLVIEPSKRYFFDVYGHTPAEIMALLNRAKDTYDNLSPELRGSLKIAMVLHGPDIKFFATDNYAGNKDLVDLAARLDAFGFVDLKICAVSVTDHGLPSDGFPPFIEIVPYGPTEISRLQADGYVRL